MKANNYCNSTCRHCQFYNPEGRRGGICSQLGVAVKAEWKSCHLSTPAFDTQWETLPEIARLEKSFSLGFPTPSTNLEIESTPMSNQETKNSSDVTISNSI